MVGYDTTSIDTPTRPSRVKLRVLRRRRNHVLTVVFPRVSELIWFPYLEVVTEDIESKKRKLENFTTTGG